MDAALALLAAWGFAAAAVSSRRGLVSGNVLGGFGVSLTSGMVVATAFALVDFPDEIRWDVIPILVVAGLFGSTLGRLLVIAGVSRLGATVHVPIQSSVQPFLGVAGGWLLFGEQIGPARYLGAIAIILGVWLSASATRSSTESETDEAIGSDGTRRRRRSTLAMLVPIAAGLAFAGSDLASKQAMSQFAYPAFGAGVGAFSSWLGWGTLMSVSPRMRSRAVVGRGFGWFILHGALAATASLIYFAALKIGDVSVVSPILASQPIWVVLMSLILLRRLERIGVREVAGASLVVVGAILIALS